MTRLKKSSFCLLKLHEDFISRTGFKKIFYDKDVAPKMQAETAPHIFYFTKFAC